MSQSTPTAGQLALATGVAIAAVILDADGTYFEVYQPDELRIDVFCKTLLHTVFTVARDHGLSLDDIRDAPVEFSEALRYNTKEE